MSGRVTAFFCSAVIERGHRKTSVSYSSAGVEMTDIHKGMTETPLNILSLDMNLELEQCSLGSVYKDSYLQVAECRG